MLLDNLLRLLQNLCSYSPDPRIQDDHPTSPKIKEEHQAKSSGESEEYDKDTKRRSYAPPHGRTDRHDANYGSKE
jgi:hypothetical protein